MNPILVAILSYALSQIKPSDVVNVVAELVEFVDNLMAGRGLFQRMLWNSVRGSLLKSSDVQAIIDDAKKLLAAEGR